MDYNNDHSGKIQWCSSGIGVTKHSLIRVGVYSTRWKPFLETSLSLGPVAGQVINPREETATVTLLSGHNIKQTGITCNILKYFL